MALYEELLDIEACVLKSTRGFAIDFGGSLIKVAYIADKQDTSEQENHVRIRFCSFPSQKLNGALKILKETCTISSPANDDDKIPNIWTCGIGGSLNKEHISSYLNGNLVNIWELECIVKAFCFMRSKLPADNIFLGEPPGIVEYKKRQEQGFSQMVATMTNLSVKGIPGIETNSDQKAEESRSGPTESVRNSSSPEEAVPSREQSHLKGTTTDRPACGPPYVTSQLSREPCFLLVVGSGAIFIKVNEDGGFKMLGGWNGGGRMLLGLGKLLTGTQSFEELISLAEAGDSGAVNILAEDIKSNDPADPYNFFPVDMIVYYFGKVLQKDEFRKEDLARALITFTAGLTAHLALTTCHMYGLKHLYIAGSLPGACPLMREEMVQAFTVITLRDRLEPIEIKFMKYGGYLGALGTLLISLEASSPLAEQLVAPQLSQPNSSVHDTAR